MKGLGARVKFGETPDALNKQCVAAARDIAKAAGIVAAEEQRRRVKIQFREGRVLLDGTLIAMRNELDQMIWKDG